ncbi:MAG TPA: hypothetical protein VF714_08470, partial [Jatrophihabitans sp.]
YRGEMLSRVSGKAVLRYPPWFQDELLAEVRRLALDPRFDPGVHTGLLALHRVRSYFVRENLVDDLLTHSERSLELRADARLEDMYWRDGVLMLTVRAWLANGERPLEFHRKDGRLFLTPEIALDIPPEERECTGQLEQVLADATIKHRETAVEFFLPAELRLQERVSGELGDSSVVQAEWVGEVRIDPASALGGRPLFRGVWDVSIRLSGLGLTRELRLGGERNRSAERGRHPALIGDRPLLAIPYWTSPHGNLSLDIDEHTMSLRDTVIKRATAAVSPPWQLGSPSLRISLPVTFHPARPITGRLRLIQRRTGTAVECPLECSPDPSALQLTADLPAREAGLTSGIWDIAVVLPDLGWNKPVRISRVLMVPRVGPPHVRRTPESVLVRRGRALVREGRQQVRKAAARVRSQ